MRKLFCLILCLGLLHLSSVGQTQSRMMEVYSITEYIDGYVIKAIDTGKLDTLNLISTKSPFKGNKGFERIAVGRKYSFEYEDYMNKMAAVPPNGFVVRIKTTVVWKSGDGISNMPVYSQNLKGLWIKK